MDQGEELGFGSRSLTVGTWSGWKIFPGEPTIGGSRRADLIGSGPISHLFEPSVTIMQIFTSASRRKFHNGGDSGQFSGASRTRLTWRATRPRLTGNHADAETGAVRDCTRSWSRRAPGTCSLQVIAQGDDTVDQVDGKSPSTTWTRSGDRRKDASPSKQHHEGVAEVGKVEIKELPPKPVGASRLIRTSAQGEGLRN